jgi:hypothetical protein
VPTRRQHARLGYYAFIGIGDDDSAPEPMPYWKKLLLDYLYSGGVKTPCVQPVCNLYQPKEQRTASSSGEHSMGLRQYAAYKMPPTHNPAVLPNALVGIDSVVLGP